METSKKLHEVCGLSKVKFGPNWTHSGNGHYFKIYWLKLTYFHKIGLFVFNFHIKNKLKNETFHDKKS